MPLSEIKAQETFAALLSASDHSSEINTLKKQLEDVFQLSDFVQKVANQYPVAFSEMAISLATVINDQCEDKVLLAHYEKRRAEIYIHKELLIAQHSILQSLELALMQIIRQIRQVHMAEIAIMDLLQLQKIDTSLIAVSELANSLINFTYDVLYKGLCKRYGNPNNQHLLIMGMGKLGGNELNFSSDIDLIFVYPSQGETIGKKPIEHQVFFTRLAQKIIHALDHPTVDGRVYRVDMRLRPLGDSGPLVLPLSAIETYYHEQGREWERFALQKMRVINETEFNHQLYSIIKPFVYRKYIDFTTLDSIREMKTLIEKELRRKQIINNIKLGKGGIREVEFFVQSIQLIHAGRNTACQQNSILKSIDEIQAHELQGTVNLENLKSNYLLLRKIEHYLQIFNDEQTQLMPQTEQNQLRLTKLLGLSKYEEVEELVRLTMQEIHLIFTSVVGEDECVSEEDKNDNKASENTHAILDDIWQLSMSEIEVNGLLNQLTLNCDSDSVTKLAELIVGFKKRVARASVSAKAVKSINRLMPTILFELIYPTQLTPNDAFLEQTSGLFKVLDTIFGRVTYIDLLSVHPEVRERLLYLCKKSPWVSEQIANYPLLLDELLHPIYLEKNKQTLEQYELEIQEELQLSFMRIDLEDEEQIMNMLREFKHISQLRIAASDLSGTLAINQVSDKLTILAQVILQKVAIIAFQQITKLFGYPPTEDNVLRNNLEEKMSRSSTSMTGLSQLAIVAYGKFGGIELSYGSDLDVVFLHNADLKGQTDNTGTRKQISVQEFYIKLVQRICHICTTKTYSGILYDIDLRLRPSGNSGLLISHIDSFFDYQLKNAWTWEHQAIIRSRVVFGSHDISQRYSEIRHAIISKPREKERVLEQVYAMREKMRSHLLVQKENLIDIKQAHGGIVDVEFIVQYLILANAQQFPELTAWSDNLRLLKYIEKSGVITSEIQKTLTTAYLTIRHATHRVQLSNKKYARGGHEQSNELKIAMQRVKVEYERVFSTAIDKDKPIQLDTNSFDRNPDFFGS